MLNLSTDLKFFAVVEQVSDIIKRNIIVTQN